MIEDNRFFLKCLGASLACHLLFFGWMKWRSWYSQPPVEVDLTQLLPGLPYSPEGPAKLGAPKKSVPSAKAGLPLPVEKPLPEVLTKPQPAQNWTLPGPNTKKSVAPPQAPPVLITPGGEKNGTGTSPLTGGAGPGANYGSPNGIGWGGVLVKWPELLNRDEVLANLRKYYPESERRRGREGVVIVTIHIDIKGEVTGVDIAKSASEDFDAAAKKVAALMRFSPAMAPQGAVPVKVNQEMVFHLEESP